MSDIEEPAAKISKLAHPDQIEGGEDMENGQEEWLSEDILTDDDLNPAAELEQSDANTSQDEEQNDSTEKMSQDTAEHNLESTAEENIEQTLNNFENSMSNDQSDFPEELSSFLVKKTGAPKPEATEQAKSQPPESDLDESTKQSEDDGNDTDELLRMLGEDSGKKEASPKTQAEHPPASSDDDDDYMFKGAKVTKLKVSSDALVTAEKQVKRLSVAKGAVTRRLPADGNKTSTPLLSAKSKNQSVPPGRRVATRAAPEDFSDADDSAQSAKSKSKSVPSSRRATRAAPEDFSDAEEDATETSSQTTQSRTKSFPAVRRVAARAAPEKFSDDDSAQSSDDVHTVTRMFGVRGGQRPTRGRGRGINVVRTVTQCAVSLGGTRVVDVDNRLETVTDLDRTPAAPAQPPASAPRPAPRPARALESVHHRDTEDENVDEDFDSDLDESGLRLRRPERMDEEVPSDALSGTDDESDYDEMPSSDSEDADEWLALDLRAERAAEYVPLLGANAKVLLIAEQERAAARLATLRESSAAMVTGRRALASQLRLARTALAQIDAALAQ